MILPTINLKKKEEKKAEWTEGLLYIQYSCPQHCVTAAHEGRRRPCPLQVLALSTQGDRQTFSTFLPKAGGFPENEGGWRKRELKDLFLAAAR